MSATCKPCGKTWTGTQPEHCTVCHETFGGTRAGDLHRVGSYSAPGDPRRCLDPTDLGMSLNARGIWTRTYGAEVLVSVAA